ncbi:hypothetical protein [Wolbachia endosymbiont of Folsomia candida]|uniref:hypothetical protein n=1 Tax=Wolbachia endosymbiont of Folsomia candida TaxID=169402 RepID=UPI000A9AD29F|nr:hypothetical protein [Wolbachia endosymbiont of Folsomia candida]APR98753.1 hypothetical protein ASM33_05960 [Wolbachia endosymbiont of Folsomia candida]
MVSQTKCAAIKNCRLLDDGEVLYYADACKGNEKFTYAHYEDLFPAKPEKNWICPKGRYVKAEYFSDNCSSEGECYPHEMNPAKEIGYVQGHCWT